MAFGRGGYGYSGEEEGVDGAVGEFGADQVFYVGLFGGFGWHGRVEYLLDPGMGLWMCAWRSCVSVVLISGG